MFDIFSLDISLKLKFQLVIFVIHLNFQGGGTEVVLLCDCGFLIMGLLPYMTTVLLVIGLVVVQHGDAKKKKNNKNNNNNNNNNGSNIFTSTP